MDMIYVWLRGFKERSSEDWRVLVVYIWQCGSMHFFRKLQNEQFRNRCLVIVALISLSVRLCLSVSVCLSVCLSFLFFTSENSTASGSHLTKSPTWSEVAWPCPTWSEVAWLCPTWSEVAWRCHTWSGVAWLCPMWSEVAWLFHVIRRGVILSHVIKASVILSHLFNVVWLSPTRESIHTYRYTVTTRMTPALRWAAMRAILMFH